MKFYILKINLLLIFINCFSQESHRISHDQFHQFHGDFRFPNGKYVTGGPMGELENGLLFLEPKEREIGGLFVPVTNTIFKSAFPPTSKTKIEFDLNDNAEVIGLWWIDEKGEKTYAQKEIFPKIEYVKIPNEEITLAGELIMPEGEGPFPVIINVHGSGRQNRHASLWSSFFTRYGIAILSFDKRGVGESTGNFEIAGYHDFADDVLASIGYLKKRPEIDASRIGIHGSSEGGWVGSIVAAKSDDLDFMIIRVGSGVSGAETVIHEIKNELPANLTDEELVEVIRFEREFYQLAVDGKSLEEVNEFITSISNKGLGWYDKVFKNLKMMKSERWTKIKKTAPIDPAEYLRFASDVPILWFLAEEDENVPYSLSKPRLEVALDEAGNKDFEIITIPGVGHNFLKQYEDGSLKYVDGYWNKMAEWLNQRGFTRKN